MRRAILAAFMPMPETAVNKDRSFVFPQHDVGANEDS